jgi:hypothetical protein
VGVLGEKDGVRGGDVDVDETFELPGEVDEDEAGASCEWEDEWVRANLANGQEARSALAFILDGVLNDR